MPKCRNWTAFDPEGAACMGDSGTERSGAERGNIEWLEKLQCSHHCQKHSAPLRWNWERSNDSGTERSGAERKGEILNG